MRRLAAMLFGLWSGLVVAATVDVNVYDIFGSSYPSTRIGEQLAALYDLDFEPTIVLVVGPSLDDEQVLEQEQILSGIDAATHGILFAIGTPVQTYTRGFSITPNDAARLLRSPDGFRVLVLGPSGRILYESGAVVPRDKLLEFAPIG